MYQVEVGVVNHLHCYLLKMMAEVVVAVVIQQQLVQTDA